MEIKLAQVIFQAINFLVVLSGLTFLLYKPVLKILEQRANKIKEAQQAAEATLKEKEGLEEYKKKVKKETDKKAAQILEEVRALAVKKEQEILKAAKSKAELEVENAKKAMLVEKKKELERVKKEFAKAVLQAAEKVLGKSLDGKRHAAIIDQQLEELLKTLS